MTPQYHENRPKAKEDIFDKDFQAIEEAILKEDEN